jgi:electron transfer flavoprotein beta subunit
MNILVCVKQVPDLEQLAVSADAQGNARPSSIGEMRMNHFDEFAVEQAVRLKEAAEGIVVDALTVGPETAAPVVKRAVGMGADRGVLIRAETYRDGEDMGSAATATLIARYLEETPYTLVLFGSMSEDGMSGQVGPMAASLVGLPYATQVISLEAAGDFSVLSVQREVEGGVREHLAIRLPAAICVQPGINRPRYPSLSNLLRANRQDVDVFDPAGEPPPTEPSAFLGETLPPRHRSGDVIAGSLDEKAAWFVTFLRQKALIR